MEKLTRQQQRVFDYITTFKEKKGYPPSVREICAATGLKSTATVHGHLSRIEKKGYILRDPQKPRAISVSDTKRKNKFRGTPVLGRVTAGVPILAQEDIQDYIKLPMEFVKNEESFILTVQGESMIEAGIRDGDKLIVMPDVHILNGDIVVAMLTDETTGECVATVKRFFKEGTRIRLQPENKFMDPIYTSEVTVIGKVIGLMRIY